ncbi:hypothetical protein GPECTOR_1g233 [Gonium pectorale]|uniref:NAD-dependent epimerase/dehydratase domain-containing protein n=1 Tax=Gonium pectorale TaxID=33097 RepID=A0A150H287_GONPE|nr:hypothetical protein GPECTOR_1g233 [Gonium pectorale]|eukprot:KXZ56267.1 hypothetical protein GPECTOR_1g233 [Gonium pectorale]
MKEPGAHQRKTLSINARAGSADPPPAQPPAPVVRHVSGVPLYDAELSTPKSRVCVTGATGYIAGPIIERLLRAGHIVHATCRDPANTKALQPLLKLPGALERLRFFRADLTSAGSFDAAIEGCEYVVHVAAPVILNGVRRRDGWSRIVEPMLQGVDNVIGAVNRTPSVRRVVMTSSISAICTSVRDRPRGHVYGEADWNDSASETYMPYAYGKMLSERRAWELEAQQGRWRLVTVLPSIVFGPTVGECGGSESVQAVKDAVWPGRMYPAAPNLGMPVVDVRDVAAVHCLAMVLPHARGSFRPSKRLAPYWVLWLVGPLIGLHRDVISAMRGRSAQFDTSRTAADLGLKEWLPLADTLEDMVTDMADKGMIKMR